MAGLYIEEVMLLDQGRMAFMPHLQRKDTDANTVGYNINEFSVVLSQVQADHAGQCC